MEPYVSIEARTHLSLPWEHAKSVPAWVLDDRAMFKIQKAHVRELIRVEAGQDSPVYLRIVNADGVVVA